MSATLYLNSPLMVVGRIAHEDLAAHRAVVLRAADLRRAEYPDAQFSPGVFGITRHAAKAGEEVDIITDGFALLQVDGAAANIAAGDLIVVHNDVGYGQKVGATAATVYPVFAIAWEPSTVDGQIISVEIRKGTHTTPAG